MNYVKNMLMGIMLTVSTQWLGAEHKDVVYVINNFGEEVSVDLTWSPKPNSYSYFSKDEAFSIYPDDIYDENLSDEEFKIRFEHKAPYSKYYVSKITVMSAEDKAARSQAQMAAALSNDPYSKSYQYSPMQSQQGNEARYTFSQPPSKTLFVVVEVDEQKSQRTGQKQIKLSRFLSKNAYREHIEQKNLQIAHHAELQRQKQMHMMHQNQQTHMYSQPQYQQYQYGNVQNVVIQSSPHKR